MKMGELPNKDRFPTVNSCAQLTIFKKYTLQVKNTQKVTIQCYKLDPDEWEHFLVEKHDIYENF